MIRPDKSLSVPSLQEINFALAEGCEEAISLSMAECKELTDYRVTSLAMARLSPRNDEAA